MRISSGEVVNVRKKHLTPLSDESEEPDQPDKQVEPGEPGEQSGELELFSKASAWRCPGPRLALVPFH